MDAQRIAEELRLQVRERPYLTMAGVVGVGWILGRSFPLRSVLAVAGVGARAVMAVALEEVISDRPRRVPNPAPSPHSRANGKESQSEPA